MHGRCSALLTIWTQISAVVHFERYLGLAHVYDGHATPGQFQLRVPHPTNQSQEERPTPAGVSRRMVPDHAYSVWPESQE